MTAIAALSRPPAPLQPSTGTASFPPSPSLPLSPSPSLPPSPPLPSPLSPSLYLKGQLRMLQAVDEMVEVKHVGRVGSFVALVKRGADRALHLRTVVATRAVRVTRQLSQGVAPNALHQGLILSVFACLSGKDRIPVHE